LREVFQQVVDRGFLTVEEKEKIINKMIVVESINGSKNRGGKTIDKKKKSI